jgi:hypothetical protein
LAPDGAYARWRSLHELAVISFFLNRESDDISQRYLEHEAMKIFKDAKEYQQHCKKIGYKPYTKRQMDLITKKHDDLIIKYNKEFEYHNGYEWIPSTIMKDRNFRMLEKNVGFDHYRVYYNKSSSAGHGGAAGFNYIGLMKARRNKVLLAGATNFGFTDALHATAISLSHITGNLLTVKPTIEGLIQTQILSIYTQQVGTEALKIQNKMEKEAGLENRNELQK